MPDTSKDWEEDCLTFRGEVLTGIGAHWCAEWDDLPIDETCYEWPCCEYAVALNIPSTVHNWVNQTTEWVDPE